MRALATPSTDSYDQTYVWSVWLAKRKNQKFVVRKYNAGKWSVEKKLFCFLSVSFFQILSFLKKAAHISTFQLFPLGSEGIFPVSFAYLLPVKSLSWFSDGMSSWQYRRIVDNSVSLQLKFVRSQNNSPREWTLSKFIRTRLVVWLNQRFLERKKWLFFRSGGSSLEHQGLLSFANLQQWKVLSMIFKKFQSPVLSCHSESSSSIQFTNRGFCIFWFWVSFCVSISRSQPVKVWISN